MGRTARKSATILAVAERAGVSPSSVSRVMNGAATVDEAIAQRVRNAAVELGYRPSALARSLVLGRTNTIAILVPDLGNPTFHGILQGLSRAAAAESYRVLVGDSAENVADETVLARDLRERTDAIVLCAPRMDEEELVELVGELDPVILINRESERISTPILSAEYGAGIHALSEHLYGLGHRRVAYLEGNLASSSNSLRQIGFTQFALAHPDFDVTTLSGGVTFRSGYEAAERVLNADVTAVLAFNDLTAMGLLSALSDRGVSVPDDLSVTGFDDIEFAAYTTPPLTTAAVRAFQMGENAWREVRALLTGEESGPILNEQPRLVTRGSTAPPRR